MTSVKKLAIHGAIWTIVSYGTGQVIRFGGSLLLTRLLVPEHFGLMAVVNTLRAGVSLFSDIGICQCIIHNKRGDEPAFLNTAWTLQVIRGWVLWLFFLLITLPVANLYNDQRLFWLIPIVGLSSIFDGFASSAICTLHRHIKLSKLTQFDISVQVLILATLVVGAWLSPSVLTLAIGVVLGAAYRMVGSYWLIPGYSNQFAWDRNAVKDILFFGRWMFAASGVTFLNEQADRLILAKLLSFQLLGIYTIAYTLASIPREIIKNLGYQVIFPILSNQIDLPRSSLKTKILRQRQLILIGFAMLLATLVTIGDIVIAILYDKRYTEAAWMMPILCCGIWFSVLFYSISPALLALGKPLYSAQSNLAGFVVIGLGLPVAFFHFGTVGAIIVIAFSDLPLYIVNLYGLWREQLFCLAQDIQSTAVFIGILTLLLIIRNYLGFGLPIRTLF